MTAPKPNARPSSEAVYDQRTQLVRDQMAKESAALDARTAKLKAMRLEREAAQPPAPPAAPKTRKKKRAI